MLGVGPLPRSLSAALRDAENEKASVRLSAVKDLARHASESPSAVATLCRLVSKDASAEVRGAAALALADACASDATAALVAATGDPQEHVRQMALIALGEVGKGGGSQVTDVVRRALLARAPAIRFQALIAASRIEVPEVNTSLLTATRDQDEEVRHVAFRLLEERAATDGLKVRPKEDLLRAASRGLRDSAPRVRLVAAVLLGRSGDRAGAAVIVESIENSRSDLDPEDVQAAIVLAGELPIREASAALARRAFGRFGLGNNAFAYEAKIALARMGDEKARASILKGLEAWTRDARTLAVVAVGRAALVEGRAALAAMGRDPRRAEPGALSEALALLDRVSKEPPV